MLYTCVCYSVLRLNTINKREYPLKKYVVRIIAPFFVVLFLFAIAVNSFVAAQIFQPPQIPNYNAPSSNNAANGITIPDQPSNPGAPNGPPDVSPTPTPTPQPDYTPIALAIVVVAVIAAGIVVWAVSRRKNTLPSPPQ